MNTKMKTKWSSLAPNTDSTLDYAICDIYRLEAENARLREALEKIVTENIGCWSGDQDAPERPDSCDKMVEIAEQALKVTHEEADQK